MKKITLWTDGFDVATLSGDITLEEYNKRTNDFKIVMNRDNLVLTNPTTLVFTEPDQDTPWEWLKELPIQEVEIDGHMIQPVWKPNRYGQKADINTFQHVEIDDNTITISVNANGTDEEVFNRYNPYERPNSDKKVVISYDNPQVTSNVEISKDTMIDENQLFDMFMEG